MTILSTDLPKVFRRIDLELAREHDHPEGDPAQRYVIIAPLRDDGGLDIDLWADHREACRVVRHLDGATAIGHLTRGPGGAWRFHYDIEGALRDETIFHLSCERLIVGEYISVIRDGAAHPYRVTAVSTLQAEAEA